MGVLSCSGSIGREELETVILVEVGSVWGPLLKHLVSEEYKHSASVQSLVITSGTGWTGTSDGQLLNNVWGVDVDAPVSGLPLSPKNAQL